MPIIDADDSEPTRVARPQETEEPSEEPSPTPKPTEEPTEEPSPTSTEEPPGPPTELAAEVPDGCLIAQPLPVPGAVVAVAGNGDVAWTSLAGGEATRFPVERPGVPAAFSPSGSYIAAADGSIWSADGEQVAAVSGSASPLWAWSPQADCLFAITTEATPALVVATPEGELQRLLEGPLTSFAVAPSGDRVVVFADDSATVYDLRTGARLGGQVPIPNPSEPLLWRGRGLLYGSRDGGGVRVAGLRVTPAGLETGADFDSIVTAGSTARCGGRVLAVDLEGQLIDLASGAALGDPSFRYQRATCSPSRGFIAVARWPRTTSALESRVVALDPEGNTVSDIGAGDGAELLPEWGPPETGVVFLSSPEGGAARVIYAQTSGGITLPVRAGRFPGFDWSATAPTGIPGTRT
jgi:hypothetical protein